MNIIKKYVLITLSTILLISCGNEPSNSDDKVDSKTQANEESKEIPNENKKEAAWSKMQVKDEFGDIIEGESTIAASFEGKMTNTAVANEDLTVKMQVSDSTLVAVFYEYSQEPQAELPNAKTLPLKIKLSNGEVLEVEQFLYKNMMLDTEQELLNLLLSQDKPIKVIADLSRASEYGNGVYNFEIDPHGLKVLLD